MSDPQSDDDELLAAELALGLIEGDERRAAEARVANDAAFAEAWRRWRDYGAAMLAGREEAPRPSIWAAIEARLPANDAARIPAARTSVRWWQAGTLAASAAAVVLGVIAIERPRLVVAPAAQPQAARARPSPPLVAVLTGSGSHEGAVLTVSYDAATGRLTSAPAGMRIGAHAAQLWVIPAGEKPRSLGVVADRTPGWTVAPGAAVPALVAGATLAISIEPIGGSPTGQPTGPVILTGTIAAT